ncbi:MAG: hypothetical protein ACWGOV_08345 [Acidiferrobacterales bacterium]
MALFQLGACGLSLGGPQSAAVKYIRGLVEQPDDSPELSKAYSILTNHVVIEYARALHKQGVKLKYSAEKLSATADGRDRVSVSIIPAHDNYIAQERDHTLIVILQYSKNEGWKAVDIKAQP